MTNLEYHKGSFDVSNSTFCQEEYCSECEIFIQFETGGWYEECLLCEYERDISNLLTENNVGKIKTNDPAEAEHALY